MAPQKRIGLGGDEQITGKRNWWYLALAVLVVQAIYWFVLAPAFAPVQRPLDRVAIDRVELASIPAPSWQAVEQAEFQAVEIPWEDCCDAGYRAVRFTFSLEDIPPTGLGMVSVIGADNYAAWINGSQFYSQGRMELPDISNHGRAYRGIDRLPAGLLRQGENQLTYVLVTEAGTGGFFAANPTLGEHNAVQARFGFRSFLLNEYLMISWVTGALVALLAFAAWARGGRQRYLFWLATLASCWAFMLFQAGWVDPWIKGRAYVLLTSTVMMMIPVAWVNLVNNWGGRRQPYILPVSLAVWAVGVVIFGVTNLGSEGSIVAASFSYVENALLALVVAALLAWKARWVPQEQYIEFAIILLCATLLIRDAVGQVFDLSLGTQTDYAVPFLLVALAAAFIARNIRLFRSSAEINTLLQAQLDERTAELAVAHEREKLLLRDQAHQEERRRIMQDMHDGIGSNLMSMLLAARRGKSDSQWVASGLQSVVDELRLTIDSMDSVGESLRSALTLFHERSEARVTNAGFAFVWQDDSAGDLPELTPRGVLQVFRILQEAITNALQHSGGNRVRVAIHPDRIEVIDNGEGFDGPREGGRGLQNMASRAQSIGGEFAMLRGESGETVARLTLPGGAVD